MNNSDFHVLNLSAYQTPEITEDPREDFISFGENNDFYSEVIDAYLNSPTTSSIVTGISNQIAGKGIHAHDASQKPDEFANFKSLFKNKCIKKVATDLKLLGEAAFQITYKGKKVATVSHFNRETLRAEKCDSKGKINAYYYHPDWKNYENPEELTRIPVFGSGASIEIYIIRRFIPSMHYYSPPDFVSSLNYSKLEAEISSYLVNLVQNSFSGRMLISMTNGIPTQEKQIMIKNEIMNKLTGSDGEKIIVSFTDSPENKTQIENISVDDAAEIYQYVAEECTRKLLLANRITSPLLVGIRDGNNGLGSNSEEIENAQNLLENIVIRPYQDLILEAVENILSVNNISLKLYIKTLTPIEFTDTKELVTKDQIEEETGQEIETDTIQEVTETTVPVAEGEEDNKASYNGAQIASALSILQNVKEGIISQDQAIVFLVQMLQFDLDVAKSMFAGTATQELFSKIEKKEDPSKDNSFDDDEMFKLISEFGEDEDDEKWELVDSRDVIYDQEEALDKMIGLAYAGQSTPNTRSKQDKKINGIQYKVRYKYEGKISENSRKFCKLMVQANKLYRKEDIIKMGTRQVNPGWGPGGSKTYSIWRYKGGGSCGHRWVRKSYKGKTEGNLKNINPNISNNKARKEGFNPVNEKEVSMRPRDMKNEGFLKPRKK